MLTFRGTLNQRCEVLNFALFLNKKILYHHHRVGDKMKKVIFVILIGMALFQMTTKTQASIIPNEAIRLRVLANSNSEEDQKTKYKVRDVLQKELYDMLQNTKGISEARRVINNNIESFNQKVDQVLKESNADYGYQVDYGIHYFPEKQYKGITYDEGNYESLFVTLGTGEGNNWWCVLFPPLCLLEAEETAKDEVEYKFFLQEIIDKYL